MRVCVMGDANIANGQLARAKEVGILSNMGNL